MRTLSAAALAKVAQTLGTEPVVVIEVQWSEGGSIYTYGDIDSPEVNGKILELSGLDNVITITGVSQATTGDSQGLNFVLDDTDGHIKLILDTHDIHKRPVWVYQWFPDLPFADKFLLFKGEVSSPIEWNEGDRSVRFDVVNKIEDAEVGFSIEEGNFPFAPDDLIGKPWPLVFGTCVHIPALRVVEPFQGILQTGFGVHDFTLQGKLNQLEKMCCPLVFSHQQYFFKGTNQVGVPNATLVNVYRPEGGCVCKIRNTRIEWTAELALQRSFEYPTLEIIRGEIFPQGTTITLDICGARVNGRFNGTSENPTTTFEVFGYTHPKASDYTIPPIVNYNCIHVTSANWGGPVTTPPTPPSTVVNCDAPAPDQDRAELGWDYLATFPNADFFWAEPGCKVFLVQTEEIIYIANLLPSDVLRVAAYRTFDTGTRILTTVPSSLYTVRLVDYNGYMVTEVVFNRLLSRRGEGWEDDIYVSQESSVGPNTVDILEYLIEKYTTFSVDATSFNAVRTKIDNYPSSFPLLERRNILEVLREIAFQARCALILRNDTFKIIYLSEEPTSNFDIDEDDVIAQTFVLSHTETEDLVTKFVADWKIDYSTDAKNRVILRYNVRRYGTQEQTFDFYIYNILELVQKSATFWLIRMANTWRRVKLSTPLTKLAAEVFDIGTLDLSDFATVPVKCIVEKATYNSDSHEIDFEFWTPVRSGEQTPYDFAWPALIDVNLFWPEKEDLILGNAGGSGPNVDVEAPAGHVLDASPPEDFNINYEYNPCNALGQGAQIFKGPRIEFRSPDILGKCRKDHGDKKPTDLDDQKPEIKTPGQDEPEVPETKNPLGDKTTVIKEIEAAAAQNEADNQTNSATGGSNGANPPPADPGDGSEPGPYDNLPEEPEDQTCQAFVEYREYTTVNSVITDMGISTSPGETGPIASSPPASGDNLIRVWFDSKNAAQGMYDAIAGQQHVDGTVGEPHIIAGTVVLGIDNWTPECEEPSAPTLTAVTKPSADYDWESQITEGLTEVFGDE